MFSKRTKTNDDEKLKIYRAAVEHCYPKRNKIAFEFFRLNCFKGFNCDRGSSPLEGILGGFRIESFHVPVRLEVRGQSNRFQEHGSIGHYVPNHYGSGDVTRMDKPMRLDVTLWDPEGRYQLCLHEAMTSAAVSKRNFLHVEIQGVKADPEDTKSAFEIIQEHGHGPRCSFNEMKVWPEIFLSDAPKWAVDSHNPFR